MSFPQPCRKCEQGYCSMEHKRGRWTQQAEQNNWLGGTRSGKVVFTLARPRNNFCPRVVLHGCFAAFRCPSTNKNILTMAGLSNVNEHLIQVVGSKPKSHRTYGRHNRTKSLSRVYDTPSSPPKELRSRTSWTLIDKDRSVHQTEDGLTPPSSTQSLLAKSSPASSPAPKHL